MSSTAPTVSFTSPAGPESWPAGSTQTLSWAGSDVDGDTLTYSLAYSVDGVDWEIIDAGLTGTSYDVETDSLAGAAAATFRVVATDGINIGSDETPPSRLIVPRRHSVSSSRLAQRRGYREHLSLAASGQAVRHVDRAEPETKLLAFVPKDDSPEIMGGPP